MATASVRWTGARRPGGQPVTAFEVTAGSGHRVTVDEPPEFGDDSGMRPTELLLGALGSCTGINAVLLLRKFRQPFESLTVSVEGDQQDDWPHAFTRITVNFEIGWEGEFDKALVEKALDLACNRYCPVDATLTHGTRIEVRRTDHRR